MEKPTRQFQIAEGRRLAFEERGPSDGKPLFYFHGSPSSRLESALFISDALLRMLGIRLISVDRPGLGLSDYQVNRRLLDWPHDALSLADRLGIERFAILAYSLGGPYGLACAYAFPERLINVGIVSGAATFTRPDLMNNVNEATRRFINMPLENPLASRFFLWMMLGIMPRIAPKIFINGAASVLPTPDKKVIHSDFEFHQGFLRMVRDATRQGTRGAFQESILTIQDWGFHLDSIRIPVILWHGESDVNIPIEMARYVASVIPTCELTIVPDEGHLSLFKKHAKMILRDLVKEKDEVHFTQD